MELLINSEASLEAAKRQLEIQFEQKRYLKLKLSSGQTRTNQQNAALHLYCQLLADKFNDCGLDQQYVISKKTVSLPWSKEAVKECLVKPILEAMTGQESTAKQRREAYGRMYDVLNRHTIDLFGISIPWPESSDAS